MWCRVILTTIAISCTFSEIIALGSERLDQIKDMICVLLLNGVKKEDLDANTLDKLQRHNVNIYDLNNEKTRLDCVIQARRTEINAKHIDINPELPTRSTDSFTTKIERSEVKKETQLEKQNQNDTQSMLNIAHLWTKLVKDLKNSTDITAPSSSPMTTLTSRYNEYVHSSEIQYVNRLLGEYMANLTQTTTSQPPSTTAIKKLFSDIISKQIRELLKKNYIKMPIKEVGTTTRPEDTIINPNNSDNKDPQRPYKEIIIKPTRNPSTYNPNPNKTKNTQDYKERSNKNENINITQKMLKDMISKQIGEILKNNLENRQPQVVVANRIQDITKWNPNNIEGKVYNIQPNNVSEVNKEMIEKRDVAPYFANYNEERKTKYNQNYKVDTDLPIDTEPRLIIPLTITRQKTFTDIVSKQIGQILNDNYKDRPHETKIINTPNDDTKYQKIYYVPSSDGLRPVKEIMKPTQNPLAFKQKEIIINQNYRAQDTIDDKTKLYGNNNAPYLANKVPCGTKDNNNIKQKETVNNENFRVHEADDKPKEYGNNAQYLENQVQYGKPANDNNKQIETINNQHFRFQNPLDDKPKKYENNDAQYLGNQGQYIMLKENDSIKQKYTLNHPNFRAQDTQDDKIEQNENNRARYFEDDKTKQYEKNKVLANQIRHVTKDNDNLKQRETLNNQNFRFQNPLDDKPKKYENNNAQYLGNQVQYILKDNDNIKQRDTLNNFNFRAQDIKDDTTKQYENNQVQYLANQVRHVTKNNDNIKQKETLKNQNVRVQNPLDDKPKKYENNNGQYLGNQVINQYILKDNDNIKQRNTLNNPSFKPQDTKDDKIEINENNRVRYFANQVRHVTKDNDNIKQRETTSNQNFRVQNPLDDNLNKYENNNAQYLANKDHYVSKDDDNIKQKDILNNQYFRVQDKNDDITNQYENNQGRYMSNQARYVIKDNNDIKQTETLNNQNFLDKDEVKNKQYENISQIINKGFETKINKDQMTSVGYPRGMVKEIADAVKNIVLNDVKNCLIKEGKPLYSTLPSTTKATPVTTTTEAVTTTKPETKEVSQVINKLNELFNEFKTFKENIQMVTRKPLRGTIKINDVDPISTEGIKPTKPSYIQTNSNKKLTTVAKVSEIPQISHYIPPDFNTRNDHIAALMIQTNSNEIRPLLIPVVSAANTVFTQIISNTTAKILYEKHKEQMERESKKRLDAHIISKPKLEHKINYLGLVTNRSEAHIPKIHIDHNSSVLTHLSNIGDRPKRIFDHGERSHLSGLGRMRDYNRLYKNQDMSLKFDLTRTRQPDISYEKFLLATKPLGYKDCSRHPEHFNNFDKAPSYHSRDTTYNNYWQNYKYPDEIKQIQNLHKGYASRSKYLENLRPIGGTEDFNTQTEYRLENSPDLERVKQLWHENVPTYRGRYVNTERLRVEGPKFHERLENIEKIPYSNSERYISTEKFRDVIPTRQQLPLTKVNHRSGFDKRFQNFIKTQEKVNDMLEKILASKTKSNEDNSAGIVE